MRVPPSLADSALRVPRSRIREIADIAFAMDDVLKLYFGESNLPTPQFIKDAATQAIQNGYTFYTENAGLPSLREALAHQYRQLHGVPLDPKTEIVVTASGVQALHLAIRCVLDPGDEALLLTPAWPNASAIVQLCSATPREVAMPFNGKRYGIDFDRLAAGLTPRTRLLVYTSPSNPLGWVASPEEQSQLLAFCRHHGLWLLADEVYERLYYSGDVSPSILRMATREDAVLVAQSFSKAYCMTGWRLGWLVGRNDLIERATALNEFVVSHAPSMVQKAGEAALRDGEPEICRIVRTLRDNLDFCRQALASFTRVQLPDPEGAFYLFPRIEGMTDSFEFCRKLLVEKRVGLAPGVAFGEGGEGSVRLCYAADRQVLEPALDRFGRFLQER
ncbi:MAG: pyridoxal phosphate-dependent aminotransferase [Acidobacteriota bacterium]